MDFMNTTEATNWITIAGITIAATLQAWGVWSQKPRTEAPKATPPANVDNVISHSLRWFLRNSAPFLVGMLLSAWLAWMQVSSDGPATRDVVGTVALLVVWFNMSLFGTAAYAVAAAFRPAYLKLNRIAPMA